MEVREARSDDEVAAALGLRERVFCGEQGVSVEADRDGRDPEATHIVAVDDVENAVVDAGVPSDQAKAIADDYGEAQLQGLKRAIGAVAIFALLSLWFTRGLPGRRI